MDCWYFAYGSNLLSEQMVRRTGPLGEGPLRPRIAHLAGYRLVFQHLSADGPAYANIVQPGSGVIGVVYRCPLAGLDVLDRYERGYERQTLRVIDVDGQALDAIAYVITPAPPVRDGKPSGKYLEKIITGARQHGLPEGYVASILLAASDRAPN
jgi:gamma-glutamylcyclotransferase